MEREAADAAYEAQHEKRQWHDGTFKNWSEKRSREFPYHYTHGVRIGVGRVDHSPWDDFTTNPWASPVPPPDGEREGDGQPNEGPDE